MAKMTDEHKARMLEGRRNAKSMDKQIQEARLGANPAQEAKIRDRLSEMPLTCRKTYLRAMQGNSQASAIKAFCLECVCWIREEVRQCTATACPLYPYRPFQQADEDEELAEDEIDRAVQRALCG